MGVANIFSDIQQFLTSGQATDLLSGITANYKSSLEDELENVMHSFETYSENLLDALESLVANLHEFYLESQLDESFIM